MSWLLPPAHEPVLRITNSSFTMRNSTITLPTRQV
jgi:hypothetical protein